MIPTNPMVLAGLAGQAIAATTIPVAVGKNGLTFEPNVTHGQQGDIVEFRFYPRNHSAVFGDFNSGCTPGGQGGFFSGFFPTQQGQVNVRLSNPQVFSNSTHTDLNSPTSSVSP